MTARDDGSPPLAEVPASMVPVSAREAELLGDKAMTSEEYAQLPRPRPPHPGLDVSWAGGAS